MNYYEGTPTIFSEIVKDLNGVIKKFDKALYEKLKETENKQKFYQTITAIKEYIDELPHANYLNNNKIDTNKIKKNWYDPNQEIEVAAVKSENKKAPVAEVVRVVPVVGTGKNPKKIQWPTYLGGLAGVILLITVLKYRNNIYTSIESFCNKNIFKKKVII
jgi:vacuolar-type H+-ATPase subunit I/STV1